MCDNGLTPEGRVSNRTGAPSPPSLLGGSTRLPAHPRKRLNASMTNYQVLLTSNAKKEVEADKVGLSGDYLTFSSSATGVVLGIRHEFVVSFEVVADNKAARA